jgi:putative membrane protein insertion efficiency factor
VTERPGQEPPPIAADFPDDGRRRSWNPFRRRRRRRRSGGDSCDACDVLDACDGCDLFLIALRLVLVRRPVVPRSIPDVLQPSPTTPRARRLVLWLLRAYRRVLSPRLPSTCRFTPSCSVYAAEAVGRWGLVRGSRLTVRRLRRCRPGGARGADPVP